MHIPCNGINIGLDNSSGDIPFLSHAHSDHTSGLKSQPKILTTLETRDLADINAALANIDGTAMLDAGHMLGARQLAIEGDGERVVYTGDISLKANIFGWKAELPQCDHLIMEATYGDPTYIFPPLEEIYSQINRWVSENDTSNLIIGSYELGKTQELIRVLNESSVAPIVTEKAENFCKIYEKYGVKLDRVVIGTNEAEEAMSRRFVAIVPMRKAKKYFAARLEKAFERQTLCAVATGWALHYRFNTDAAFALSDHADFDDLVYYIEQSEAKDVEFFCGDGSKVLAATKGVLLNI
ncbi:MBL fold metallo-hydrolase [Candidatus Micrarchaeota archaeon]|nr:MBL fold metallo-hydrolase [Candidatus Micrarchaeota archaeon]